MQALIRENKEVLYGSMVKDTLKRKHPSFTESSYGYSSFSELLEDARDQGIVEIARNQKAGGTWVVTGLGRAAGGEKPPGKSAETARRGRAPAADPPPRHGARAGPARRRPGTSADPVAQARPVTAPATVNPRGGCMKVVAFNGSARKDGNTALLLKTVLEELAAEGIDTELYHLAGKPIQGCIACYQCFKNKDRRCAVGKDIVNECVAKMVEADGILLGSPTYFADVTRRHEGADRARRDGRRAPTATCTSARSGPASSRCGGPGPTTCSTR